MKCLTREKVLRFDFLTRKRATSEDKSIFNLILGIICVITVIVYVPINIDNQLNETFTNSERLIISDDFNVTVNFMISGSNVTVNDNNYTNGSSMSLILTKQTPLFFTLRYDGLLSFNYATLPNGTVLTHVVDDILGVGSFVTLNLEPVITYDERIPNFHDDVFIWKKVGTSSGDFCFDCCYIKISLDLTMTQIATAYRYGTFALLSNTGGSISAIFGIAGIISLFYSIFTKKKEQPNKEIKLENVV